MNIENIKNLWSEEKVSQTPEISIEKQQQFRTPLEKIRANMEKEFWFSVFTLAVVAGLLFLCETSEQLFVFGGLYLILILITVYYFRKFYSLYKRINTQSFSTYHNLLNLRYELVLNTELYKSYYISSIPIAFCFYWAMSPTFLNGNIPHLMLVACCMVVFVIALYIIGKMWLKEMYGKYIVEISDLVTSMSDENDEFQFGRDSLNSEISYIWYTLSRGYFEKKFGKAGKIINGILWVSLILLALFIASFCVGFIIGFAVAWWEG